MHESGEDYIETIYLLKKRTGMVRSIDVANELNFSRPSVSRAVGLLKEDGLITVEPDGELVLTELGLKTAKAVYEKHKNRKSFRCNNYCIHQSLSSYPRMAECRQFTAPFQAGSVRTGTQGEGRAENDSHCQYRQTDYSRVSD